MVSSFFATLCPPTTLMMFSFFSSCCCFSRQRDETLYDSTNAQRGTKGTNELAQPWTLTTSSSYSFPSSRHESTSSTRSFSATATSNRSQHRSALQSSGFYLQPSSKRVHWSASSLVGQPSVEELSANIHIKRRARRKEQTEREWHRGRQPLVNTRYVKRSRAAQAEKRRSSLIFQLPLSPLSPFRSRARNEVMYLRFQKPAKEASVLEVYEHRCARRTRKLAKQEQASASTRKKKRISQPPPISPSRRQSNRMIEATIEIDNGSYWSYWESSLKEATQTKLSVLVKQQDDPSREEEEIKDIQNESKTVNKHYHRTRRSRKLDADLELQRPSSAGTVQSSNEIVSKDRKENAKNRTSEPRRRYRPRPPKARRSVMPLDG